MLNEERHLQGQIRFAGKTKLTISILLCLAAFAFVFKNESTPFTPSRVTPPEGNNISNEFLIWSMDVGKGITNSGGNWIINYSQFQDLNFNVWHKYPMVWDTTGHPDDYYNNGWTFKNFISNDRLFTDVSAYQSSVLNKVITPNDNNSMYTLMDRAKIEYLCYGARSDYQAETQNYIQNQDLWFYNYQTHQTGANYEETFNNEYLRGRYCGYNNQTNMGAGWMNDGYVVKDLFSNREQIDVHTYQYQDDANHTWYVKPRIRVPEDVVNNFPNTNVCRIDIHKWDGTLLRSSVVQAGNFEDAQHPYNGGYIDAFFGLTTLPQFDKIPSTGRNEINPTGESINSTNCGVDYRIYWYGDCEMWLDYVRVENEAAKDLLAEGGSSLYDAWLQEIAGRAYFHIITINPDEFEINNLPCIRYVEKKMKECTNGRFALICLR